MRREHLEALRPICPHCRSTTETSSLELRAVQLDLKGHVIEGALHCSSEKCSAEYPIVHGMPLVTSELREAIQSQLNWLLVDQDLSPETMSRLGDAIGPVSALDAGRRALSSYGWDHYGDVAGLSDPNCPPGGAVACLQATIDALPTPPDGPILDLGCATGRTTFKLAEQKDRLVLGMDLSVPMLRLAGTLLRTGKGWFPLRRVGLVYDRIQLDTDLASASNVDFWLGSATNLPFASGTFAQIVALNVLDCTDNPLAMLGELARVLMPGGQAIISTPHDWNTGATPFESWLGGHSQRGRAGGASDDILANLLTPGGHPNTIPGVEVLHHNPQFEWRVRVTDRRVALYSSQVLAFRRQA
jgi:SAM-dependent methyltransferase/uncharacterized protein YbaR (Trm112 family)